MGEFRSMTMRFSLPPVLRNTTSLPTATNAHGQSGKARQYSQIGNNLPPEALDGDLAIHGHDASLLFGSRYATSDEFLFIENYDRPFFTHRATWATALIAAGARCTFMAPDTGYMSSLQQAGINVAPLTLGREDTGILAAASAGRRLLREIVRSKASTVFLIQTAAYTLGALAAPFARSKQFIRVAGGTGTALNPGRLRLRGVLIRGLLRLGARQPNVLTLFQTEQDREFFLTRRMAAPERSWLIPGTGVDPSTWSPAPSAPAKRVVLFASRLNEEKGIREFVEMARSLRDTELTFHVIGEPDFGNITYIREDELAAWREEGVVQFFGHREDMPEQMRQAWLLVFPSKHPEGTPKVLIEAAVSGLPAIASDQPGCRAVVEDGITGWILPDVTAPMLAEAVSELLADPALVSCAADAARARAVEKFSYDAVLGQLFELLTISRRSTMPSA